jgi:hypothetical protein
MRVNWVEQAKQVFDVEKPEHFTNHTHCDECWEHDQTLRQHTFESITINELGNPGWDPICFCSNDGKKYYMPALVRLCLQTVDEDFYFSQLLFHLELDGPKNLFYLSCSEHQRQFVHDFIDYMITNYATELELAMSVDEAFLARDVWAGTH